MSPDGKYYYAIEHLNSKVLVFGNDRALTYSQDIALAQIFETGAEARRVGRSLEGHETIRTSVHPASTKIFFEAHLKGLR